MLLVDQTAIEPQSYRSFAPQSLNGSEVFVIPTTDGLAASSSQERQSE